MTAEDRTAAGDRYVLEILADGAILLDLESGMIFQLNSSAAFIWQRVLAGRTLAEVCRDMVRAFGIGEEAAHADADAALGLPETSPAPEAETPFRYELVDRVYRFSDAERELLEVSPHDRRLRVLSGFDAARVHLYLTSITPKIAALMGLTLLHASAVVDTRGTATLFVGPSGAGKTTTARALVRANEGWRLLAEDKVVLRPEPVQGDGERVVAVLEGERHIHTWMAEACDRLGPGGETSCPLDALGMAATGTAFPTERILLIERTRRRSGSLDLSPLGQTAAAREIFRSAFYGSHLADEWRRQLRTTAALGRTAPTFLANMPDGLDALDAMARSYADTTTS